MLEVENIYIDNIDDQFNFLKKKLDAISTWTKQKHEFASEINKYLITKQYIHDVGHKNRLYLTGGIGTSLLYKVPESKKGKFSSYRGQTVRLVNMGSNKTEVGFYIKALSKNATKNLTLLHRHPQEIRFNQINNHEFWIKSVINAVIKRLDAKESYAQERVNFNFNYSEKDTFKLKFIQYYLPKNVAVKPLFGYEDLIFSTGIYVVYIEICIKVKNFNTFTNLSDLDYEILEFDSKYIRFIEWNNNQLSDKVIKKYIKVKGFLKGFRSKNPNLEQAIQLFFIGSHPPEIESIKNRLKPFFLVDNNTKKQIRNLFMKLSSKSQLEE
ncbi:hypothetical protein SAMN06296008_1225 [Polynucleobacter kasalickyi]|uniref:Uncharacterized protein n=2 Tax=Polynucleobacter kasalickyi TaxID=1938817 RepID=A0A1W2CCR3_9BURK|nr:hypothetical protein SAMN06296008_1225 [Polynucleobacter kasalickyi]